MTAYYNEINPDAAKHLRNLIEAGAIAPGIVDERSIEDVLPDDLRGFTQCHFFAGVGVWSYALRRAGWPDERPVWTGSCPCQPFSAAGKGTGFADERHLWPAFHYLISQLRPAAVFGEQVASKDANLWIDLVHADMEAMGYAFGCVPFPSAGVGAPHIRDRSYWLAYANGKRCAARREGCAPLGYRKAAESDRGAGRLDNADNARLEGLWNGYQASWGQRQGEVRPASEAGELGWMADTACSGRREERPHDGRIVVGDRAKGLAAGLVHGCGDHRPGPTNGLWRDADWLFCRDGKWRPVEPGTFPLAHGSPARVGRLRAYGNAINAEAAVAFIEASGLITSVIPANDNVPAPANDNRQGDLFAAATVAGTGSGSTGSAATVSASRRSRAGDREPRRIGRTATN